MSKKDKWNFRKWWYLGNDYNNQVSIEASFRPGFGVTLSVYEDLTLMISCLFFTVWLSVNFKAMRNWLHENDFRHWGIDIYHCHDLIMVINWNHDESGWKKEKGLHKYINFTDLVRGKSKHQQEVIEEKDLIFPMPEKGYKCKARIIKRVNSYPRWFATRWTTVEFDFEEPIPCEGKGENSYDCGVDHTHSMSVGADNFFDGVGKAIKSLLEQRVRYGGWGDFCWKKEIASR